MKPTTKPITRRGAWPALVVHNHNVPDIRLRKLFADDPTCGDRKTLEETNEGS